VFVLTATQNAYTVWAERRIGEC